MNYGQLKEYVRSYVNRTDLTDGSFDIWQLSANQRMGRDTRIVQLDSIETIANPAGTVINTTADFNDLLSIAITGVDAGPVPLVAVSWEMLKEAEAIGLANGVTQPYCYCMFNEGIKVAPGNQADFTFEVIFRAKDTSMVSDADTNIYLTNAQSMYIEAILVECYKFLRDIEGESLATARYEKEVQAYSSYYAWQHSGSNLSAVKGAWSWD